MTGDSKKPDELTQYPVMVTLPLQWGEMDAFGHVNNTVYFRWFETARIVYLAQGELSHLMSGAGMGPILASINCNFKRQLTYPDTVHVGARVSRIGRSSLTMEHAVYSPAADGIAAVGESVVVMFDYDSQRPKRMPAEIRQAFEKVEGRPLGDA